VGFQGFKGLGFYNLGFSQFQVLGLNHIAEHNIPVGIQTVASLASAPSTRPHGPAYWSHMRHILNVCHPIGHIIFHSQSVHSQRVYSQPVWPVVDFGSAEAGAAC
jgi:hypothetical protein